MQDIFEEIFGRVSILGRDRQAASTRSRKISYIRPETELANIFCEDQILLFQKRTAVFMRCSFPNYAQTLNEAELEKLAITIKQQADVKGFSTEKEIWHYLVAAVYCGFFFEQDVQYTDMLELVGWHKNPIDKMLLLDRLLSIIDEYALECEKDYADFDKKLQYLAEFYTDPQLAHSLAKILSQAEQKALAIKILKDIFPQRLSLWTDKTQDKLVSLGLDRAKRMGFDFKESLFYLVISVYFGRGFEQSPFYPWAYFLQNFTISPQERIKHFYILLEKHLGQLTAA